MIRFACPGCSATFTVADEKAGKSGKCPKCQSQFVIPATGSSVAPASADVPSHTQPPPLPTGNPPAPLPPPTDPNQPVEIQPCPKCNTRLTVLPGDVGFDIQCPSCETVFKATRADAPPPPDTGTKSKSKGSSSLVKLGSGGNRDDDDEGDRPSRRRSRRDEDDDDRPSRRSRRDDDDRPSRRRSRRDDDRDEDDDDDRPSRRRSRRSRRDDDDDYGRPRKPSQLQTIGILLLIGGIWGCLTGLSFIGAAFGVCFTAPGGIYAMVYGIMAIVVGSQLLGQSAPPTSPRGLLIMAIICIVNCDIPNLVFGIVGLNMLNSPEVLSYYNRR